METTYSQRKIGNLRISSRSKAYEKLPKCFLFAIHTFILLTTYYFQIRCVSSLVLQLSKQVPATAGKNTQLFKQYQGSGKYSLLKVSPRVQMRTCILVIFLTNPQRSKILCFQVSGSESQLLCERVFLQLCALSNLLMFNSLLYNSYVPKEKEGLPIIELQCAILFQN